MNIGFTGTRKGMTPAQRYTLRVLLVHLREADNNYLHHGGEPHADAEAAEIAREHRWVVVEHSPEPPLPQGYLERNRHIVNCSQLLIAAPHALAESVRSGTWYTVRYARREGVPVVILDP